MTVISCINSLEKSPIRSSLQNCLALMLYIAGLQNLCISSSVVCVIILLASLVVFWVGFILRQVPPVLIVSVLYVLAGKKSSSTNTNGLFIYGFGPLNSELGNSFFSRFWLLCSEHHESQTNAPATVSVLRQLWHPRCRRSGFGWTN